MNINGWVRYMAVLLVLVIGVQAQAVLTWDGGDGDWDAAGIWSGTTFINNAPVGFTADILSAANNSGTLNVTGGATLTVGQIITGPGISARRVVADLGGGLYALEYAQSSATDNNGVALVANTDVSARFGTAGITTISGTRYLNQLLAANITGTRTITGGGGALLRFAAKDGGEAVGLSGAGSLVFDGVSLSNGDLTFNNNLNLNNVGSGQLVFKNSVLTARDGVKFVNAVGSETVFENVTFDATQAGRYLQFQRGVFTFAGSSTVNPVSALVGIGGDGETTVNIAGGASLNVATVSDVQISRANVLATVNVGGTLQTAGKIQLAYSSGTGILNVDNGGWVRAAGDFNVGNNTGLGTLNINNGGRVEIGNAFYVGAGSGTGVVNINDGGFFSGTSTANLNIGWGAGTGIVNVNTGGTLSFGGDFNLATANVAGSGHAILNINGGYAETVGNKWLYINKNNGIDGSSAIVNLSSGTLSVNDVTFGSTTPTTGGSNTAQLNVTGGRLIIRGGGIHTGNYNAAGEYDPTHTASDTQVNLGGGTLQFQSNATIAMPLTLTGSNGNIKFEARGANDEARTVTLNGVLSGTGGLEVTAGTLLLNGANTYAGATIVSAGTLELNNMNALGLTADLALTSGAKVIMNYSDSIVIDHLLLDGNIIDNLTVGTAYYQDQLNDILGLNIFSGYGQLTISAIPEPSLPALLGLGLISALVLRRLAGRTAGA